LKIFESGNEKFTIFGSVTKSLHSFFSFCGFDLKEFLHAALKIGKKEEDSLLETVFRIGIRNADPDPGAWKLTKFYK
jgi:hypothetical protein